jgi:ferredoxin--NADP+ reductase
MSESTVLEREIPLNLYRHGAPLPVLVLSNRRLTPLDCANDVHHVVVQVPPGAYPFLEGQSAGFAPPGLNSRGRPNVPRLYSIACDRDGDDGSGRTVAMCVKRVRYVTESGDDGWGLASNMLCDAQPGDVLQMTGPAGRDFVMHDEPALNHVLIATGTGIAPFRAFAQRREKWPVPLRGQMWLFFGVQTQQDALYGDEWAQFATDPRFHISYAFSREQKTADGHRVYVQERIREAGPDLLHLVRSPRTHVYICGIKGMETGVEEAMTDLALQSGLMWQQVRDELRIQGRWHVEVY